MKTQSIPSLPGRRGATVLLTLGLLMATCAQAAAGGFELAAVADRRHGELLLDGHFDKAIAMNRTEATRIERAEHINPFSYAASTNLCVAHAMRGRLERALTFCDAAVAAARQAARLGRQQRDYSARWAAALSNRGVVRALSGDDAGAREDLRRAVGLADVSGIPARNLERLDDDERTLAGG